MLALASVVWKARFVDPHNHHYPSMFECSESIENKISNGLPLTA